MVKNFLDVTVSLIEELTETDLYVKPTDSHQYLQSSCLQSNCVTLSIVKRVYHIVTLLKLHCICSGTNYFDKRHNNLKRFLLERGYSSTLVGKKKIFGQEKIQELVVR